MEAEQFGEGVALQKLIDAIKAMTEKMQSEDKGFYDSADIKMLLNISDKTLYRYRKSGQLHFFVLGGKYYYPKTFLKKVLRKRR
ncbi:MULTISPECIES: helix-turn-helix domain-containing protein [Chryseobacterium]|uniref:helix-turn-helix domain-containing protein n=1 Tax=Chryseobacterium sp. R2A-55 TaxID=2744445 RepID=UPI001F3F8188|nr:helix-turn-helix domain-containing protein [Chryseobacterium sp. R2A-55]